MRATLVITLGIFVSLILCAIVFNNILQGAVPLIIEGPIWIAAIIGMVYVLDQNFIGNKIFKEKSLEHVIQTVVGDKFDFWFVVQEFLVMSCIYFMIKYGEHWISKNEYQRGENEFVAWEFMDFILSGFFIVYIISLPFRMRWGGIYGIMKTAGKPIAWIIQAVAVLICVCFILLGAYTMDSIRDNSIAWIVFGFCIVIGILVAFPFRFSYLSIYDNIIDKIKKQLGGAELATLKDLQRVTDQYGFYTAAPSHHWFKEGHIITVGGSGSGKGACMLIPSLISPMFLQTKTSVFCFDPKGENYAVAKGAMERAGYQVWLLNPMNILKLGTNHLNIFDLVNKDSPDIFTFCRTVAESLSPEGGKDDTSDHFSGRAKSLLIAYMLYMYDTNPQEASFNTLFDLLSLELADREILLAKMSFNKSFDGAISREAKSIINGISGGGIREISGIYSNATKAFSAFQDYNLRAISKKSDFSIYSMLERPTAIFLSVKLGDIDGYSGWIRTLVRLLTREIEDRGSMKRRTLFILDEFPQLGYMKDIVKGFETLRSFGATFHIVLQDLERLKGVYPKEYKSFISNSSVKHIMKLDDLDMAKVFSEISGRTHDVVEISESEHASPYIKERPVIPADELMRNFDTHYILINGMPNFIKMPKVKYFENPYFKGQYGHNPYY